MQQGVGGEGCKRAQHVTSINVGSCWPTTLLFLHGALKFRTVKAAWSSCNRAILNWAPGGFSWLLWSCATLLFDWLNVCLPVSRPIRSKGKTKINLPGKSFCEDSAIFWHLSCMVVRICDCVLITITLTHWIVTEPLNSAFKLQTSCFFRWISLV